MIIENFKPISFRREGSLKKITDEKAMVDVRTGIWPFSKTHTKEVFYDSKGLCWCFTENGKIIPDAFIRPAIRVYRASENYKEWQTK